MAGQKISLLPSATSLLNTDQIVLARGGVTLRLPGDAIASKTQLNALIGEVSNKAPTLSASDLYTKTAGISSVVKNTVVTYSHLEMVTGSFDRTFKNTSLDNSDVFLTKLSAETTFIFKSEIVPTQGNILTWIGGKWIPSVGVETIVNDIKDVDALDVTPIGGIAQRVGSQVPLGYFACDGASITNGKITYPDLFAVIGYQFGGSGDNFSVPNIPPVNGIYSFIKRTPITGAIVTDQFLSKSEAPTVYLSKSEAVAGYISKPSNPSNGQVLTYANGTWQSQALPPAPTPPPIPPYTGRRLIAQHQFEGETYNNAPVLLTIPEELEYFELHLNQFRTGICEEGYSYQDLIWDKYKSIRIQNTPVATKSSSLRIQFYTDASTIFAESTVTIDRTIATNTAYVGYTIPAGIVSLGSRKITNPSGLNACFTFTRSSYEGYWVTKNSIVNGVPSSELDGTGFVNTKGNHRINTIMVTPTGATTGPLIYLTKLVGEISVFA